MSEIAICSENTSGMRLQFIARVRKLAQADFELNNYQLSTIERLLRFCLQKRALRERLRMEGKRLIVVQLNVEYLLERNARGNEG